MEIRKNEISINYQPKVSPQTNNSTADKQGEEVQDYQGQGMKTLAAYNAASVKFKGYYGNQQPAKKLFWILTVHRETSTR